MHLCIILVQELVEGAVLAAGAALELFPARQMVLSKVLWAVHLAVSEWLASVLVGTAPDDLVFRIDHHSINFRGFNGSLLGDTEERPPGMTLLLLRLLVPLLDLFGDTSSLARREHAPLGGLLLSGRLLGGVGLAALVRLCFLDDDRIAIVCALVCAGGLGHAWASAVGGFGGGVIVLELALGIFLGGAHHAGTTVSNGRGAK